MSLNQSVTTRHNASPNREHSLASLNSGQNKIAYSQPTFKRLEVMLETRGSQTQLSTDGLAYGS